ncbi:hypothetical protein G9F71_011250 [Clostridium sp. FP2]|uniref:hypothetical protein n=1 Tax=Clostridium sp. FP2 TaxID=2724481 RepID=UPI0013E96678|nr:hypothetical protein [Clostridium sp. FP2]MBZ9623429.1 hypothetical protein [Clostridium sp. FP2]
MICNNCNNEFTNISGLKFCPYCGEEIEEDIDSKVKQNAPKINNIENENITTGNINKKNHEDTQPMPVITEKNIKKYNRENGEKFFDSLKKTFVNMKVIREKKFASLKKTFMNMKVTREKKITPLKKTFMNMKVVIPIIALLVVIGGGVFAYTFFIARPVDEVRIKEDLMGKIITLPKGTSIKMSKDNMKSFSINTRNTDKSKDEIKIALTLNNGAIEAKTLASVVYTYQGKNQWKISDGVTLDTLTAIKPVVGMDEKKFLEAVKKLSITIADTKVVLGGQDVKSLAISLKTPDLEKGKEEILMQTSIDSGLLATTGKIKCKLVFENEAWRIATTEKNSTEDFALVISPTFSNEKVIEAVRENGLEETVTYSNFFGGKGFTVKDSFTKSINVAGKRYDAEKGVLYVNAKRENTAGEIKSVLTTGYTFSISLSKIALTDKAKTTVNSGTINNVATPRIISTITNVEVEGSNLFFWWSNNHKITPEEAKTFKTSKILSKKGFENIKYVYGSITYKDDKKNKSASGSFVALYFLVYDGTNGYNWKLDKIIGADSPNYNALTKEAKNQ